MFKLDPEARKRSLMIQQPALCNGAKTGHQCTQYWAIIKKMDVPDGVADHLRQGEKLRFCMLDPAEATNLGDDGCDMAVYCNRYEQSNRPYDPDFEVFKPMTPEEITSLDTENKNE